MNLTLNFVDPKEIDRRLIEAENLKTQATRDEDYEKRTLLSATKLLNIRNANCKIDEQDTPIISEKEIEAIVEQKQIFLLGI